MSKYIFLLLLVALQILAGSLVAQTVPQAFNYQAVVRNAAGQIVDNQAVGIRISIIEGSVGGTAVYSETHQPTTNAYGLVTLTVGSGTVVTGDFATISWGTASKFLKVEVDPAGGTSYMDMGTTQLLSVPYALYAGTSEDSYWKETSDGTGVFFPRRVGIGTSIPSTGLHVRDSSVLFFRSGIIPPTITEQVPVFGQGRRLMWLSQSGSFRAGYVDGNQWDQDSIGSFSSAFGYNNIAAGDGSFATGYENKARGENSFSTGRFNSSLGNGSFTLGFGNMALGAFSLAAGSNSEATGENSIALGYLNSSSGIESYTFGSANTASSVRSIALGNQSKALANSSVAIGLDITAGSYGEVAVGLHNTYLLGNTTSWDINDRAFVVGVGNSPTNGTDGFTVYKSGEVKIGSNGTNFTNLKEGEFIVGSSTNVTKDVTIPFPSNFSNFTSPKPVRIIVQPVNENATIMNDEFIVTVKSVTNSGVVVRVRRIDANIGWAQNLKLQWMAWQ